MRVIHVSDLHLGTATYEREDPSSGVNRRVQDFFKSFDQIVGYAVDKTADVILLCGDIFKDGNPTPTLLKMFASRLRKILSKNIKVIIIPGNHDSPKTTGKRAR
jgi:exonuclease SbcD